MRNKRKKYGLSLIEVMLSVAILGLASLSTLGLLAFARLHNSIEQERTRAHQIVTEAIEKEYHKLFTYTSTDQTQTIWDNLTPNDTSDDTIGLLDVKVWKVNSDGTRTLIATAPEEAVLCEIEATLTWTARGSKLQDKAMRESAMIFKVP